MLSQNSFLKQSFKGRDEIFLACRINLEKSRSAKVRQGGGATKRD